MFREHVFFSQLDGDDETKFKKCHARVRYVSVPPCDLIGAGPPAHAPYRQRIVHHGCDISQSRPASKHRTHPCPLPFPPTLGLNRGICARPVSEGHATAHARAHGHVVTDSRQTTKKEWSRRGGGQWQDGRRAERSNTWGNIPF